MKEQVVRLVCFELCGQAFAFNMDNLIEIVQIRASEITPCFTPVPVVRGTWMYREKPIYVIDLREFFNLNGHPLTKSLAMESETIEHPEEDEPDVQSEGESEPSQILTEKRENSMLVIQVRGHILGMFTDSVLQVVPLGMFYEFPDLISTLPRRYFAGIIRVRNTLALVMALEELLSEYAIESLLTMQDSSLEPEAPPH